MSAEWHALNAALEYAKKLEGQIEWQNKTTAELERKYHALNTRMRRIRTVVGQMEETAKAAFGPDLDEITRGEASGTFRQVMPTDRCDQEPACER